MGALLRFRPGRRSRARSRGQSLVEFALVLPVFMFTLFALIDVGRLVYLSSTLSQAAREGARLGSVEASYRGSSDPACGTVGGPICPANDNALWSDIQTEANDEMSPFGAVTNLYMSCVLASGTVPSGDWTAPKVCSNHAPGNVISVRVTGTFQPITPLISQFLGSLTLSGSATMTIN